MRKIIIDCDPGHDDAVTIMLAYSYEEEVDLAAITTVCGNNTIDNVTHNACIVNSVCEKTTPIFKGASRPLIGEPIISSKYHGETGMDGPVDHPEIVIRDNQTCAVEAIRDLIQKSDDPITIVALAPLTNIALFIRTYPELAAKIKQISLMGGSSCNGNITQYAEFKIFVDPEAAEIIFTSGIPITMSSLDITEKALVLPENFEYLRDRGKAGRFFCEMMDFYMLGALEFGAQGCMLHDPCALAWLLRPELFSGRRGQIHVVLSGEQRGRTVFTPSSQGNVLLLSEINVKAFGELIISAIEALDT